MLFFKCNYENIVLDVKGASSKGLDNLFGMVAFFETLVELFEKEALKSPTPIYWASEKTMHRTTNQYINFQRKYMRTRLQLLHLGVRPKNSDQEFIEHCERCRRFSLHDWWGGYDDNDISFQAR